MRRFIQIAILIVCALAFIPFVTPAHVASCEIEVTNDKGPATIEGPISVGFDVRIGDNDLAALVRGSFAAELERRHPGSAIAEGPRPPPGGIMLRLGTTVGDLRWFPFWARVNLTLEGKAGKSDVKHALSGSCVGLVNQKKFMTAVAERLAQAMVNSVEAEKAR